MGLGESLAGTILIEEVRPSGEKPHLYLNQLAVDPRHRGKGIGRFLLGLAEERANERGVPRLRLDTAVPAAHLVSFYRSVGYEVVGEIQWPGKIYRSFILEKRLPNRKRKTGRGLRRPPLGVIPGSS